MSPRNGGLLGDERGLALVMVLLVLSLLLVMAGEFAVAMRLEGTITLNYRATVAAGYLAEAGYHRALAELLPGAIAHHLDEAGLLVFRRSPIGSGKAPERRELHLGSGHLSYRITDEEARLHLNVLARNPEQLHRLLTELGVERDVRDVIVDSIQDWRDPNEEYRLNGAESDYYLALPVPYRSKNADFDSVDELLQVRGVTPQVFYGVGEKPGLVDYLTVAGSGRINLNTASDVVLRTLGLAQAEVEVCKAGRPYLSPNDVTIQRCKVAPLVASTTFRIEATGELPDRARRALRAVVQRSAGQPAAAGQAAGGRVTLKSWRWLEDAPVEASEGRS